MAERKSSLKNTTAKKQIEKKSPLVEEVKTKENVIKEEIKRNYKDSDVVVCRSITRGYLAYIGNKSGEKYVFENYDDTCEIEVRDLNALRASKSQYLYAPLFIIEDEDFVSQPRWEEIKAMYDKFMAEDINDIIEKPLSEFKAILSKLPQGYQTALYSEVATRIHNEEFDSLNKIKAIDEICGTDLYCLIS